MEAGFGSSWSKKGRGSSSETMVLTMVSSGTVEDAEEVPILNNICFVLLQVEDGEYIDHFHTILKRFFQALGGIVPIFTYMVSFI